MPAKRDASKPQKRSERLIEVDLGDEVLLYDERTNHAHALNGTAAAVWRALDGRTSRADLGKAVGPELNATQRQQLVALALDDLAGRDLLDRGRPAARSKGLTRREILRGLAAAGAIAPVIATVETAHAGPGIVSAITCTTPGCTEASLCPGTVCCACVHTTENTNVCVIPTCIGGPCTSSAQCPPGWVCFTNLCCQTTAAAGGGQAVSGQCVPLCQNPQAPCPAPTLSTQKQKQSWMAR